MIVCELGLQQSMESVHITTNIVGSNASRWGMLDTTLCDKDCQWLVAVRWYYPGTPASSTNKKYFTVGSVPKYKRKILERSKSYALNTHVLVQALQSGRVKSVDMLKPLLFMILCSQPIVFHIWVKCQFSHNIEQCYYMYNIGSMKDNRWPQPLYKYQMIHNME